jgi:hypothetical protein
MIEYQVTHYYQPTNNSCSQASLAMVLSYFGKTMLPETIISQVPVNKNAQGEDWGTLNQELATWCIGQGYTVHLCTADFQIIDLAWIGLAQDELLARMEVAKTHRDVPALGQTVSQRYMQSYIDFVKAGGKLQVVPYMTSKLLDELLAAGPYIVSVCFNVLHTQGRTKNIDDIDGHLANHSVVVRGKDEAGNYLIADPWQKPGFHTVSSEHLLAAMDASQIECDNLLYQLRRA